LNLLISIKWTSQAYLSFLQKNSKMDNKQNASLQKAKQCLKIMGAMSLIFRYYLLPHYFIYASMPVYIALSLTLMNLTYKNAPFYSFAGAILSIIGGVYFVGVLGAYLSSPIGSVVSTNILKISFALCLLVFVGNILIGISLYKTNIISKLTSLLFIIGNFLILIFPGIENWMALGSLMMIIAMFPLTQKIFINNLFS